jgi:hypothetical protein
MKSQDSALATLKGAMTKQAMKKITMHQCDVSA